MVLLTALSTLSLNMFLPSLARIADDLEADYAVISLAISGYLACTAVIQLVVGALSDRLGRRPVLLVAVALFCMASLGCALAQDAGTFLICRMLQGAMITGYTLSLAMVRDTYGEREAASRISYISMAMGFAPMIGPVLGGALDASLGWRASFYVYALAGIGLLALCWHDVRETRVERDTSTVSHMSDFLELGRSSRFWSYAFCNAFSVGAFYIFLTGAPLVAQRQFGVSTAELGVLIGTITAGFIFGGWISARATMRVGPDALILTGRLIACTGPSIGLGLAAAGALSPLGFFGATVLVGLGNGLTVPGCNARALSVRPKLAGSAAGLSGALTVALGALLTAGTGALLPDTKPAFLLLFLIQGATCASLGAAILARRQATSRNLE
ncbi:MAG: multidrug effflux MFS transporter [Pseudomonadota bacterium]